MELRDPDRVMRLDRMGAAFPTRLSFMRSLVRRMAREKWRFEKLRFDVDENGFGTSVFAVHTPERTYSLLVFTHDLPPEKRTDRVIAEAWDATFNLIDGVPSDADIERLSQNTPRQEAGRFTQKELVLARANRSVRLFEHVVGRLAAGQQPDIDLVVQVGYLMRTTAVYGNGKFGIADRARIEDRPEARGSFQIEMLAVYLFRWFTLELVQHMARARGGEDAAELDPETARYLGIGNATGLGMAPFLARHPRLVDRWVVARETALARVRAITSASDASAALFHSALKQARLHLVDWRVDDVQQTERITRLKSDLNVIAEIAGMLLPGEPAPWDRLYRIVALECSTEGQELLLSLMLEPHGDLVDDLAEDLAASEHWQVSGEATCGEILDLLQSNFAWALAIDFADPVASEHFWYYSEEKLEPRLGRRIEEPGADREMPLAIARDVKALADALQAEDPDTPLGALLVRQPEHLFAAQRVQLSELHPYAEIRDNLIARGIRPIDILRFKLALFGASRFDPKSDLWTRISMYQGAPLPGSLDGPGVEGWSLSARPGAAA